ncbi:MAG TPA: hypothetical protein VMY77_14515 [Chitinophagaceae bacterium]|nr:hypothetical protein [Chitinophagaceae bacterium]
MINYKGKEAARLAVNTYRNNLLSKIDMDAVRELSQQIIDMEFSIDDDFSREGIIAREVSQTTWQSFCRFGDKKNVTNGLILYWIDRKGMPLDEQAMWINNDYNVGVLPDELAEFMMQHDRGKSMYEPYRKLSELKGVFKELTGFTWSTKWVRQNILISSEEMAF